MIYEVFVDFLFGNDEKWLLLRNIPISRLECRNLTLFMTKMAKTAALFRTKTAEKPSLLGRNIPHDSPPYKEWVLDVTCICSEL